MNLFDRLFKEEKMSRLDLADHCFGISNQLIEIYLKGKVNEDQLRIIFKLLCNEEGRKKVQESFEKGVIPNEF